MQPLLFTSIPPRRHGTDFAVGNRDAPQEVTIRSWLEGGFTPVSVHLVGEIERHPTLPDALRAAGVECMPVAAAVPAVGGAPPLCPIIDLLQAIRRRADDAPIAIINADILLAGSQADGPAALTTRLVGDEFLIGQRTDFSTRRDGSVHEAVFPHGFDFLALHRGVIDRVVEFLAPSLAFGCPWWDHYLPLALIACGVHPRLLDAARFRHEVHANRWNWQQYCTVGKLSMRSFQAAAERIQPPVTIERWADATHAAFGRLVPRPWVDGWRRLAMQDATPGFLTASFLKRQAAANVRLILQSSRSAARSVATVNGTQGVP